MPEGFAVARHSGGERRTRGLDAALAALAGRQHGVVARRQLRALGLRDDAIDLRLRRGRLHIVHRGVYAVGHRLLSRDATFMAAVLVSGDAVLSHRSAAVLWGLIAAARRDVEISVPRSLRP